MPFPLLGFDTDNDSVFMNATVKAYCADAAITFTRCRPYKKNDQAFVEQKNGAVVRRIVGYRRFEGLDAAAALARLYRSVRLFVNLFQPSFKLAEKTREGALVRKRYHPPATPAQRLLSDPRTSEATRLRVEALRRDADPIRLLSEIRAAQHDLVSIADRPMEEPPNAPNQPTLQAFLSGLRTVWQEGEVRPTARPKDTQKRLTRRPDPFASVTTQMKNWFDAEPWRTSREFFERLQAEQPNAYPAGQLRTLQRRMKDWRREAATKLVIGFPSPDTTNLVALDIGADPMLPREYPGEANLHCVGSVLE